MRSISNLDAAGKSETETVRSLIRRMARERGAECFLIDPRRDEKVSFEECHSAVLNFAQHLQNRGARKGDKVACMVSNGRSAVELLLGTIYGGQVAVPLNGAAGSASLAASLEHSDARLLFVDADHRDLADEVIAHLAQPPAVIPAEPDVRDFSCGTSELSHLDPDDDALLAYTSGSTGRPKGVLVSHRNLLSGGSNTVEAHRLTSSDRSLCVLPLYHMNAQVVTLMSTLLSGGSVVVPERFQALSFWKWVEEFRCTWFALAPTTVSQLVENASAGGLNHERVPECVRFARCSSAPLAPQLHQRFEELFELPLIEAMGSTEAGGAIFSNPLPPAPRKAGSPGLPVGFQMRVVDQAGADLATGETGEILVRGPSVMKGYYKEPAATAEVKDADGWLRTGDLGFCDSDGYVRIVGRSKEIIIKGGENVAPREIDEVLLAHPAVLEAAAVGISDPHLGQEILAYVVLRSGEEFHGNDLLAWCRKRLGSIKTPSLILPVDFLPRGPTGKVLRKQLAESANHNRLALAVAQHATPPPAGMSVEALVLRVWEEALGRKNLSAQDNFFRLGGHSLLAMDVLIQLHQVFGVSLSFGFFCEHPTPTRQARAITQELAKRGLREEAFVQRMTGRSDNEPTIPLRDRSVPCPLSPAQRSIWFLEQLHPGLPLYVEARAVRIRGKLDVMAVEAALNALVARHEMLRTAIRAASDGSPAQFVEAELSVSLRKIACYDDEGAWQDLLDEEARRTFDLSVAPLLRTTLIEIAPDDYVLSIVLHHLACDGYSLRIFFTELWEAYAKLIIGRSYAPPPLSIQYGDYAAWKCGEGRSEKVQRDLLYWKDRLEGVPHLFSWRIGSPRPAQSDYRGTRISLEIASELTEKLRGFSQGEGISLFTLVVAALEVLLSRLCGQAKFLLGIPVAHREKPELMPLIGHLVEVLVLRADLSRDRSFREYVRDVDAQVREMYAHDTVPFDTLVQELGVERGPSHEPLVQVMLNWRISGTENLLLPGLELSPVPVYSGLSKFDLTVSLCDGPDGLNGSIECRAALFDAKTIRRLATHFMTLLEAVASQPDCGIWRLPLLTPEEHERIVRAWNQTARKFPRDRCIHELFAEQVKRSPQAVAVVFGESELSYGELERRSGRLAWCLKNLGVRVGSKVVVCIEPTTEMIVGFLAILRAGGVYVPIDSAHPEERIGLILEQSEPVVVLTRKSFAFRFRRGPANLVFLDEDWESLEIPVDQCARESPTAGDLAYILFTSGSTGTPKGVCVPHRAVNRLVVNCDYVRLGTEDVVAQISNCCFDAATFEIWSALLNGCRLVGIEQETVLSAERFSAELKRHGVTTLFLTSSLFNELVHERPDIFCNVRNVLVGGEECNPTAVGKVLASGGPPERLVNVYGPTETTTFATWYEVKARQSWLSGIPIGRPIANTTLYILDPHLNPVPIGLTGEIWIGGEGVASGYLNLPELTAERFVASPLVGGERLYRTGDLGRFLADGNIEFLGRLDNQIKMRGFRVEPGEVENVLRQHPAVATAVVIARSDGRGSKQLVAYVTASRSEQPPSTQELREFLGQKVPDFMVPAAVVVLERLPLTPNGKIDQLALPQPALDREELSFVAPRSEIEQTIAKVWSAVLEVQSVGAYDDFFRLGGHSLLAMRVVSRLRSIFAIDIPLRLFFEHGTVAAIADYISGIKLMRVGSPPLPVLSRHEETLI